MCVQGHHCLLNRYHSLAPLAANEGRCRLYGSPRRHPKSSPLPFLTSSLTFLPYACERTKIKDKEQDRGRKTEEDSACSRRTMRGCCSPSFSERMGRTSNRVSPERKLFFFLSLSSSSTNRGWEGSLSRNALCAVRAGTCVSLPVSLSPSPSLHLSFPIAAIVLA